MPRSVEKLYIALFELGMNIERMRARHNAEVADLKNRLAKAEAERDVYQAQLVNMLARCS